MYSLQYTVQIISCNKQPRKRDAKSSVEEDIFKRLYVITPFDSETKN